MGADGGEQLGLFDRVDAQIGFQIQIGIQHLGRVAGFLTHSRQHVLPDGFYVDMLSGLHRSSGYVLDWFFHYLILLMGLLGGDDKRVFCGPANTREVFFQDHMEVGAAKTECARACKAEAPAAHSPFLRPGIHSERQAGKGDVRVGFAEVGRRRQHLVMQRQNGFQQTRRAGRAFQVTDVRFDRSQCHRTGTQPQRSENGVQAAHLGQIAHFSGGAVPLDQASLRRIDPGVLPGALDGALLPQRIGGSDPFAFAIRTAANPTDNRVDAVVVAFRIFQPFEQKHHGSLAHHKPIGSLGVRAGAVGAQRADLAEFDV